MVIRNDYLMRLIEQCVAALSAYTLGRQVEDPQSEIAAIDDLISELTGVKRDFLRNQIQHVVTDVTPEIAFYLGQLLERRIERLLQLDPGRQVEPWVEAMVSSYARAMMSPHAVDAERHFFETIRAHSERLSTAFLETSTLEFVTAAECANRFDRGENAIFFLVDSDLDVSTGFLEAARGFYHRLLERNAEVVRSGGLEPDDIQETLAELTS